MNIAPSIKNTTIHSLFYGLFIACIFINALPDYPKTAFLIGMLLVMLSYSARFHFLARKNIKTENTQLIIDGNLVSILYKWKWLSFLKLDFIKYESSPWRKGSKGTLEHYMFSKEDWALLRNMH